MPIPIPEYLMYGAYCLNQQLGHDIAIAARGNGTIISIARDTRAGPNDISTPIVNLLQNNPNLGGQYDLFTTYAPTEACQGMAKIRRVRYIYEMTGAGLQRRGLNGAPPWALTPLPGVLPSTPGNVIPGFAGMNAAQMRIAASARLSTIRAATAPDPIATMNIRQSILTTRVHDRVTPPPAIPIPPAGGAIGGVITPLRRRLFLITAYALVAARDFAGNANNGHAIGCVLVDTNSAILGCSLNSVSTNSTYHAETLAVMQYLASNGFAGLPLNCNIFTTLQCCHMCAGLIVTAGNGATAHYGQPDIAMNNNALARGVSGSSEIERNYVNFTHQLDTALGGWNNTITALNSDTAKLFSAEAIHQFRRLKYEITTPQDTLLWAQCQTIINSIHPNLV
ncbi:Bd3614 family nucleic acid deaminase [Pseudomonas sp.]|jgi:tRNA(Arg) A34 adenosine deaminase TadA|uniref:Bd3614 family nucleic acid deaminase n=1 Tax=Pseudomonas sp. TaxID=306 RepID=UPI003A97805B